MASPSSVLTQGLGSWGSSSLLLTLGLGSSADLTIDCTLGTAVADGITANIDQQVVITGTLGTAVADGFLADINTGIVARSNNGGGWPEYKPHKKSAKKLKKEYFELPFTLLEDEKEDVEDKLVELRGDLHDLYAKPKTYEGLSELIIKLQEAIDYEKLKLEVIAKVEEERVLEAKPIKVVEVEAKPKRILTKAEEASIAMYLMYDEYEQ